MAAENGREPALLTAVSDVTERVSLLVREEVELAKVEMTEKVSSLARGGAAVAVGAVFGLFALIFGLETLAWGLAQIIGHIWVGFAITFVGLLLLTIFAFLFALRKFKKGVPPAPTMAIEEARKIRATVSASGGES